MPTVVVTVMVSPFSLTAVYAMVKPPMVPLWSGVTRSRDLPAAVVAKQVVGGQWLAAPRAGRDVRQGDGRRGGRCLVGRQGDDDGERHRRHGRDPTQGLLRGLEKQVR